VQTGGAAGGRYPLEVRGPITLTGPARRGTLPPMDWTGQPANFVAPTRMPGKRTTWNAALKEALDALLDIAPEVDRETLRALIAEEVSYEAPRSWMRDVRSAFARGTRDAPPTAESLVPAATRFHGAISTIRAEAEQDADYFASPLGQALVQVFQEAMFHSIDSPALGRSIMPAMKAIVLPALRSSMMDPHTLILPQVARQRWTVSFEVWANRFRNAVADVVESWYRPLVSAFYRLSRIPVDDKVPADVVHIGQLFQQAQIHWPAPNPLSVLVERRVAIVRNSEAHSSTEVCLETERFVFTNKNKAGVEIERWTASPAELERLAVHVAHLGDVMQTFLLVMPFRSLDAVMLFSLLADLFSSNKPAQS
jgi:hypothetical protein